MKPYFIVSLCKNGILGGGIVIDTEAAVYHTGKLTVPKEYRRLAMPYRDIAALTAGWLGVLPTVLIKMNSGEEYRFLVFRRQKFIRTLRGRGAGE